MRPSRAPTYTVIAAVALLSAGLFPAPVAAQPWPETTGNFSRAMGMIGGRERSYVLYEPRDLKPGSPLLFVFHGGGGDGPTAREGTGHVFDVLADKYGFVVIYPDGIGRSWTGCRKVQNTRALRRDIDDVGFVEAMIEHEVAVHGIDRKRVFAVGHSMGGQLTYRLALERPHAFAGIAAISSNLPAADNMECTPLNSSVPVMIVNGTADPVNPYDGGTNARGTSRGRVLSTEATAQYFVERNGLADPPEISRLPHTNPSDRTWVEQTAWTAPGKSSVVILAIHGGGHVVPQPYFKFPRIVGPQTEDLDTPTVIWDFFSKAPIRE